LSEGNQLSDFPPETFTIATFYDACGLQGELDRDKVPPDVTVQQLPGRLRCSKCGKKGGQIRILYTGAGGYQHS
jgi:hypothetical protein